MRGTDRTQRAGHLLEISALRMLHLLLLAVLLFPLLLALEEGHRRRLVGVLSATNRSHQVRLVDLHLTGWSSHIWRQIAIDLRLLQALADLLDFCRRGWLLEVTTFAQGLLVLVL